MVNLARFISLIFCFAGLSAPLLQARPLSSWQIGETADETVSTPMAFEVVDPAATAARQAEAVNKTPAIFLRNSSITNATIIKLETAFAEAHSNFMASLEETYHQPGLRGQTNLPVEFEYFVTAFNVRNKKFPIATQLAREWAAGQTGQDIYTNLLNQFLRFMANPVRADRTPKGFELGASVRLVPVHSSHDPITLEKAEQMGELVPVSSVSTITRLRTLYRREFSAEDQLVARTLSLLMHPDCELEPSLTRQAYDRATSSILVTAHYAAGDVVVQRGEVINAKIHAALAKLNELVMAEPNARPGQPSGSVGKVASAVQAPVVGPSWERNLALVAVASSGLTLGAIVCWRWLARRKKNAMNLAPAEVLAVNSPGKLPVELAPQLAEALKSAVVQELAAQRRELLQTQQNAAAEVFRLMQRLNDLQVPSQERLGAYENRILELEKELAARTEENRELLKLKIEMLRQQLETERAGNRVNFN